VWLGSVRGPLFLPKPRHIPLQDAPLMITLQHPPRIVIQTAKRSWNGRGSYADAEMGPMVDRGHMTRSMSSRKSPTSWMA